MNRSPAEIRDRWLNYWRRYARYPTLWDSSLAFASGPLAPESGALQDYSGRTSGAIWNVGAGDVPKYVQGSVRGVPFWAGQYEGNDYLNALNTPSSSLICTISAWVNPTSLVLGEVIAKGHATTLQEWRLQVAATTGAPQFVTTKADNNNHSVVTSSLGVAAGSWSHIAAVHIDNVSSTISVNGTQTGQTTSFTGAQNSTTQPTYIGRQGLLTLYDWIGGIAGVAIWSRQLSQSEISTLARHPLAAYTVDVPRYWSFAPTASPWLYARRRPTLIGSGLGV